MAVVERLSRGEIFLDSRPHLNLAGIREQHAHDGALFGGLFDGEQGLARHPSVGDCLFIGLAFALSDDDVEAVVAQVAGLTRALNAVADDSDCFVLQHFACLFQ